MSKKQSSNRERRHFTGPQKTAIVKAHLVDGKSVAELCEQHQIQPTQFYQWQKQLFENAAMAFERPGRKTKQDDAKDRKIEALRAKLQQKNEVVSELLEEHVQLKKELGDL